MWIAKPVKNLSPGERARWAEIGARRSERGEDFPLGQTLAWVDAMEATGIPAYLVFSPEEGAGGTVFQTPGGDGDYECVNGPVLDWDDPAAAPRQLATFAMAVSKAAPRFRSLTLKPRWEPERAEARLARLPVEAAASAEAATIVVPLLDSEDEQRARFSQRLRRTLAQAGAVAADWLPARGEALDSFADSMARFGEKREFFVPPPGWFRGLVASDPDAYWLSVTAEAKLLIAFANGRAHYLFGHGPAAAAHWRAMREARARGAREYDLNGYVVDAPADHPYRSVCEFKEQFGGRVIRYFSPEFRIE
jgi:hypothetical protein